MTRFRFYNDTLLLTLIRHLKATMQPTPAPLTIYHLTTYCDDRKRVIIGRRKISTDTASNFLTGEDFIGQSMAMVQTMDPRTRQPITQPMQFDFPIPAKDIHEAFSLFDTHQEPGFHKHLEALKIASIKQGADLSQLPKPDKN